MKKEQKLVALCAVLPVLADFIEDLNDNGVFRQGLKNKATMLMKQIEKVDRAVLRIDEANAEQIFNDQIELQQSFREILLTNSSEEISEILKTSQMELKERFGGSKKYQNKIKEELNSILKFRPAENYLNLKIRQRYWVMFFMEQFKNQLESLDSLILLEMKLN